MGVKANEINNIVIKGNNRISNEAITIFSDIEIGNQITNKKLNDIIINLYETNFFEDVSVNFSNGDLLISVVESPIIDNVEFLGIKAEKIKNGLNSFINLKSRSSYNEFLILKILD